MSIRKTPIRSYVVLMWMMVLASAMFTGCKKDDDPSSPLPPTGSTYRTTVVGTVADEQGMLVIGATVKMGTYITTTDVRGHFFFTNADVPKDRMVFTATKSGYFKCIRAVRTQKCEANYIRMVMSEMPAAVNIDGTNGGVVSLANGASITFPQNAFVDKNGNAYTGVVKVYARHINPAADKFESMVPGGDLTGVNAQGHTQILYSMGMIEALLKDNTGLNEIKLATGKTAELKMPIDPSQSGSALSTIPMWYLKEDNAKWMEEGQATKTGNFYIGTVSHFTPWNCDYGGERTDIQGKVVDCENHPMPNIVVTINGFMNVTTDNNGSFTTWVPVGYLIECQVLQIHNPGLTVNSPVQSLTAVGGVLNIIPTLVIPCATRLMGSVKSCGGVTPSQSYIYATWNGGSNMLFTANGSYKIYVPENTTVNITAQFGGFAGTKTASSGTQGTTTPVPTIELCSALPVHQNKFTIVNGTQSTNYFLSNVQSNTFFFDVNVDGIFESAEINLTGTANPGNYTCSIHMTLNNNAGDTQFPLHMNISNHSTMNIQMDTIGVWSYYSGMVQDSTTENMVHVDDFGGPGGVMNGRFEFSAANGKIKNGEFSVIRSY